MCNFIIRPIKSYVTLPVYAFHEDEVSGSELLEVGAVFTPSYVGHSERNDAVVYGKLENGNVVGIELDVFIHTFSDKDPNKKDSKKS